MPSRNTSPPLVRAVLAAVWLASCRGNVPGAQRPGCDNGKLHLQRDLAEDVYRDCPVSAWPQTSQKHPAADRVYDPEPARQICMDKPIFYKQAIPNSGAYRPVMAENGEYVYCPPQRWLNNLHHAATILLHHPCVPVHERMFLSVLARSCLTHYILTSHPELKQHTPLALVSWGRTLELSTAVSLELCDWLETTTSTRTGAGASQGRRYNLLLTRSAEEQQGGEEPSAKAETPRQCCERIVASFLVVKEEEPRSNGSKRKRRAALQAAGRKRDIRAASAEDSLSENLTEKNVPTLDTSPLPGAVGSKHIEGLSAGTASVLGSNVSRPAAERLWPGEELNHSSPLHPVSPDTVFKGRRSDNGEHVEDGHENDREGGLGHEQTRSDGEPHHRGEKTGPESVTLSQSELAFQPQFHHHIQTSQECDGCRPGERCECDRDPTAGAGAPPVKKGLPKSPRTDEAVWAAAALGSLLVLLALAVLHTRLYRHWRITPSLYWYNPQQDYESVADVMRRRLRIANRRSKRSRRKQCVLLPVSSSSDEN